ncbi:MAG TPA: PAS domain-containing protein [Pseudolabrys sp.]|jgi:PAS domain S-box-containing protein|nr:PAS domain-containing protein [Pseudolabrys sp.]
MSEAVHALAAAVAPPNLSQRGYGLLEHIPIGILICDRDGTVTYANKRAVALHDLTSITGSTALYGGLRVFDHTGRPLTIMPTAHVLRNGEAERNRELVLERRDGHRVVLLATTEPLFDEEGELTGAMHCLEDITARKRAEAHDAQGTRTLQAIIETTPECIKVVAADGTLLQMNAAGCEMLGVSAAAIVGGCVFDVIAPEHRDLWRDNHARVCRGERATWQFDIISATGAHRHVETHAAPLTLPDGSLAHLAVTRDITERRRQEAELQQGRKQLQDLLEGLPTAVYTTDAEGTITFFNQASAATAGRTPCVGEDKWSVGWKLFKPDGTPVPHEQCPMAVALRENRAVRGEELVVERPDGTRIPIIPYPTPIRDHSGRLIGAVNVLVDISERRQAEYRQRMLLDELNHRVKNNLQMLHALLRTAQRETEDKEARAVLEDAAHRVGAIAASQRALYGSESASSFNTREFLHAVCQAAQQTFAGDVKIKIEADSGEMSNEISMPLALILNELLTNAVKHGLKGRRHGTVKVELARRDNGYVLAVEDGGDGFELKPSARRSSGLGLIRGLARQLGGHFTVERGDGARCIVTFPDQCASLH